MKPAKRLPNDLLSVPLTLLAAVLLAGGITILALWCQPNALRVVLSNLKAQPLLIVLNAMPIGLLILSFTCLFRNVFFSAALVNVVVCGLSIANRIKIEVRDEPVFPRDLGLLKEVGSALGNYDISFPVGIIALIGCITVGLFALGLLIECKPLSLVAANQHTKANARIAHSGYLRSILLRLLGAVANLLVLAGLIVTVYASNALYNSFRVSNPYYVPSVFNELGFPYCFCHQFTTYSVDRPNGFRRATAEKWESSSAASDHPGNVNVIMVMNEAFSDITNHAAFAYTEENTPLPNLQALRQDPHAITGHLVVPNFAAGTANTEFDVLTGIQTNALSAATTSSFRVVNRDLDSLFRSFGATGYHTSYFHPGDDWFYNRENVLRWMGAKETVFIDEMKAPEMKGRWVTDDYMADLIEAEFEAAVTAGETLFHYSTTIQNHMSYTTNKYGSNYLYPPVPLTVAVSEVTETLLKVYAEGARDADAMLGRLRDYFSQQSEPVVLVFFGDHLPYLGDHQQGYAELGFTEDVYWAELTSYETPFVIWANDAAFETLDWSRALELPDRMSASFLGAAILELTGHSKNSAWFSFLNDLRRETPVIQKNIGILSDSNPVDIAFLDDRLSKNIQKWRQWSYYKLKYQEFK